MVGGGSAAGARAEDDSVFIELNFPNRNDADLVKSCFFTLFKPAESSKWSVPLTVCSGDYQLRAEVFFSGVYYITSLGHILLQSETESITTCDFYKMTQTNKYSGYFFWGSSTSETEKSCLLNCLDKMNNDGFSLNGNLSTKEGGVRVCRGSF